MTALVVFQRLSDGSSPERELLEVADDGSGTAWRSNGRAVGRFQGPVAGIDDVRAAVEAAGAAAPPDPGHVPADASEETVEAGGVTGRFVARRPVEGAWAPLVDSCRKILDALVEAPFAAVGLVLEPDGSVRLEHRGSEALSVELASLTGTVKVWRDRRPVSTAPLSGEDVDRVEAGPGWSMTLAAEGLDITGGDILTAEVTFVADDAGVYVPVRATGSLSG